LFIRVNIYYSANKKGRLFKKNNNFVSTIIFKIMKKKLYILLFVFSLIVHFGSMQAQTTVADGNWSSPMTWGGAPPMGAGTVVINHNVVLDADYSHTAGSITINASGSLSGASALRIFALNYPSGTASLTVNGTFNVARVPVIAGSITNNGNFGADSLANFAVFNNNSGAIFNVSQFANYTTASYTNNGSIICSNLLNTAVFDNYNSIQTTDFMNCKTFTNNNSATVLISHDFFNSDSLASPALLTNNGQVNVGNDWRNDETVEGSGRFCVQNNSMNTGILNGTFDFCDLTGGNIDANTGTVAPTITYCLYSCGPVSIDDSDKNFVSIFPVPSSGICNISSEYELKVIDILSITGKLMDVVIPFSANIQIDVTSYPPGVYFVRCVDVFQNTQILKMIVQ
jgi:hypothetical protein